MANVCANSPVPARLRTSARLSLPAAVLFFLAVTGIPSSHASVSITEMARLEAALRLDSSQIAVLFRGYDALGLLPEAAALLERKIHSGEIGIGEAAALVEEAVSGRNAIGDPSLPLTVCDTALRNGMKTPAIRYACGTSLRLSGRMAEARAILAGIGPDGPLFPYALYSIGQISAQEGDLDSAEIAFRRAMASGRNDPAVGDLSKLAADSLSSLLIATGRKAEALPIFEGLLMEGPDPIAGMGKHAAGQGEENPPEISAPEDFSSWSCRKRIDFFLLEGGIFMERGEFSAAIGSFLHAGETMDGCLASADPPESEMFIAGNIERNHIRRMEERRSLRQFLSTRIPAGDLDGAGEGIVELLARLLFLNHGMALEPERRGEILHSIEMASLYGVDAEKTVEALARKLDTLQNLAHPIRRYRLLSRLEKIHAEIERIRKNLLDSREAAVAEIDGGGNRAVPVFMKELGAYIGWLAELRETGEEARAFLALHFNEVRRTSAADMGLDPADARKRAWEAALFFEERAYNDILPAIRDGENAARKLAWEKRKEDLKSLRPVMDRRMADALVAKARALKLNAGFGFPPESLDLLKKAASYLDEGRLPPDDRMECAINIGSVLVERTGGPDIFPGRKAGEGESSIAASVLPVLAGGPENGKWREEALPLAALLSWATGRRVAGPSARDCLSMFPDSPFSGDLAVRLAHDALLSGKPEEAASFYGTTARNPAGEAAAISRYMLAWMRARDADPKGALSGLASVFSDSRSICADPSPLDDAATSLAVRVFMESDPGMLADYFQVHEKKCDEKILLIRLGTAEERRGEPVRAAAAFEMLARRFADDDEAPAFGKRAVENLLKGGLREEAYAKALGLTEMFGRGSAWGERRQEGERERASRGLSELLKTIAELNFEDGLRKGSRKAMSDAAAAFDRQFAERGEAGIEGDPELKLKWAVALLKSGDARAATELLLEVTGERSDETGERAAVLYAETVISGYGKKEFSGDETEDAALILLGSFPSEKAAATALRAAVAFLDSGDHARAARMAGEAMALEDASRELRYEARLVRAESSIYLNELGSARSETWNLFEEGGSGREPAARSRAKDLHLLASIKQVDEMSVRGDWKGAAKILEELGVRFAEDAETADFLLRAMRSCRMGGDQEGAARNGLAFLAKYPSRPEAVEAAETVGPVLETMKEFGRAADIYFEAALRFPKNEAAPRLLFRAARISGVHGDPKVARKRFDAFRAKYPEPRWMAAYSAISSGLLGWKSGAGKTAMRDMETGIRLLEKGVEREAPGDLDELAGKAQAAMGEYWMDQFRKWLLVAPLEKNLAIKDKFFRKSLEYFEKSKKGASLETTVEVSRLSGDLYAEFGRAILGSQRPKGMKKGDLAAYEDELAVRARSFFQKALDLYANALQIIEEEHGTSDLAVPILGRMEETVSLLETKVSLQEGK